MRGRSKKEGENKKDLEKDKKRLGEMNAFKFRFTKISV